MGSGLGVGVGVWGVRSFSVDVECVKKWSFSGHVLNFVQEIATLYVNTGTQFVWLKKINTGQLLHPQFIQDTGPLVLSLIPFL